MFQGHARLRAGHKGLFFERLDAALTSSLDEPPRLTPMARGVYHNRARAYDPATGRFIQRDPNGTAASVLTSVAMHGRASAPDLSPFAMQSMYGDGLNLYQYLGSNPFTRSDPTGLSWDPFSMVDEYLAEDAGNKAAFLNKMVGSVRAATIAGLNIASWLPVPIVGSLADVGLYLMGETSASDLIVGGAVGVVLGGAGKAIFKYAPAFREVFAAASDRFSKGGSGFFSRNSSRIGKSSLPAVDYTGTRGLRPHTLAEKNALEEVASGGWTEQAMENYMKDAQLQNVRAGNWIKVQRIYDLHDGTRINVHASVHVDTGLVWDVKIKDRSYTPKPQPAAKPKE